MKTALRICVALALDLMLVGPCCQIDPETGCTEREMQGIPSPRKPAAPERAPIAIGKVA